uniref:DUF7378 domain-containing protein n=1 Tax=Oryza punctata TaxID=4537 RepID=A0A0E0M5K2_ORYPU
MANRGYTLDPLQLLYQIKSGRATNDQTRSAMQLVPPALTVGEANSKSRTSRAVMWVMAIYLPSMFIAGATFLAYELYTHPFFSAGYPWCLPAVMLWGVYMALVAVVRQYMDLFLPNAPAAVREALVDVGWLWVGVPVFFVDYILAYFGHAWMVITMICLLGVLIAGVLVLWVSLVRTYGK